MDGFQKHKVFLSHSSKDKKFAERLASHLLDYKVDVWFDQWEVYGGDSITDEIQEGLRKSAILIFILSNNSINSKWVNEEYKAFHNMKISNPHLRIIPVVIESCEIPLFLKDVRYIQFSNLPFETAFDELVQSIFKTTKKRQPESVSALNQSNSKLIFLERAKLKQLDMLDNLITGYDFIIHYTWQSIDKIESNCSKDDIVEFFQPATKKAADIRQECASVESTL